MVQYGRCQQEPEETHCSTRLRPLQRWYGILAIYDEEDVNSFALSDVSEEESLFIASQAEQMLPSHFFVPPSLDK